jgi:RNA polymerase sigma factor (sigma-70 family)
VTTVKTVRTNAGTEESSPPSRRTAGPASATEMALVEQICRGDAEAGRGFIRDYYADVYHYLLFLTGRRDAAEDLTQETFVRAWRGMQGFEGRAPLRLWLHRIAHREFLRALRNQRTDASLEQIADPTAPGFAGWTETIELREAIRRLPVAEREVITLHHRKAFRQRVQRKPPASAERMNLPSVRGGFGLSRSERSFGGRLKVPPPAEEIPHRTVARRPLTGCQPKLPAGVKRIGGLPWVQLGFAGCLPAEGRRGHRLRALTWVQSGRA